MLSESQYNELLPHKPMLKHVAQGGSGHNLPISLCDRIWNELGQIPYDTNCNECRINLVKDIYTLMTNYESK